MAALAALILFLLWCLAALLLMAGATWLVVAAFQVSVWWGVSCAVLPPALLPFMALHWRRARRPALVTLAGMVLGAAVFGMMVRIGMVDLEALGRSWELLRRQL